MEELLERKEALMEQLRQVNHEIYLARQRANPTVKRNITTTHTQQV